MGQGTRRGWRGRENEKGGGDEIGEDGGRDRGRKGMREREGKSER